MLPDRGKRGTGKGPVAGGAVEHLRNWKKPVWLEQNAYERPGLEGAAGVGRPTVLGMEGLGPSTGAGLRLG